MRHIFGGMCHPDQGMDNSPEHGRRSTRERIGIRSKTTVPDKAICMKKRKKKKNKNNR